ncbi:unnamed protein product [Pleuronectes platessa]|uniref:Uncharacterized protein n=1 Tax=Pleuronectes platessa TaxID=8262 RepID=A0A9N7UWV5_PLEPL|nr:unnamed protein product [Pleuronectes platessa]
MTERGGEPWDLLLDSFCRTLGPAAGLSLQNPGTCCCTTSCSPVCSRFSKARLGPRNPELENQLFSVGKEPFDKATDSDESQPPLLRQSGFRCLEKVREAWKLRRSLECNYCSFISRGEERLRRIDVVEIFSLKLQSSDPSDPLMELEIHNSVFPSPQLCVSLACSLMRAAPLAAPPPGDLAVCDCTTIAGQAPGESGLEEPGLVNPRVEEEEEEEEEVEELQGVVFSEQREDAGLLFVNLPHAAVNPGNDLMLRAVGAFFSFLPQDPHLREVSAAHSVSRTRGFCGYAAERARLRTVHSNSPTQMDIYVALLSLFFFTKPALGSDQDYQIDIIHELDLANATYGITQVAGLHNGSKAFLFRDVGRAVHAPAHITEKVVQLFRSKSEFTFLASIQQKSSTSGVIFSIHESEHR